jgi:hypothetical protein
VSRRFNPTGKHPAAFINNIGEEGSFEEAMHYLQSTWDDLVNLKLALIKLGFIPSQIGKMQDEGRLGDNKVY